MTTGATAFHPTITVGFDDSEPARAAIRWAAAQARAQDAILRVVTAWDPSPITPWNVPELAGWRATARKEAELGTARVRATVGSGVTVHGVAVEGRPGRVMVDQSRTSDLLVVGSAGRLGMAGLLSGSVSRQCVHRACCPVVVLGPNARPDPTQRLVLSSTLDPDGETYGWVARWLARRSVPVHVIASYDIATDLPELALADTPARIRASVRAQNEQWLSRLRIAITTIGASARLVGEVVEGTTLDVLRRRVEPGDLLVVPSGCEHSAPFADASCPIAVVPAPHHAHSHAREPSHVILDSDISTAAVR
jgi:nucleotide-binding universal stress UspA family protein